VPRLGRTGPEKRLPKSWRGASIAAGTITECVRASGGAVCEISGENTPMAWCCGVKA